MKNKKWGGNVLPPLLMISIIVIGGNSPAESTDLVAESESAVESVYEDIVGPSPELLNRGGQDVAVVTPSPKTSPASSRKKPVSTPTNTPTLTSTPTPALTPTLTPTPTPAPTPTLTPAPTLTPTPTPVPVTPSAELLSNNYTIENVSPEVLDMYLRMVASEAGAKWSYEGSLMIAQVIVNRVKSGHWGDLYGVLTAKHQFTPYTTGIWQTKSPTSVQRQASLDALGGKKVFGENVLYFCTIDAYNRSDWFKTLTHVATYDNTMFFSK